MGMSLLANMTRNCSREAGLRRPKEATANSERAVWRLDRLERFLLHLIETVAALDARGSGFLSLTKSIDTSTSRGHLIFHVFGACARPVRA